MAVILSVLGSDLNVRQLIRKVPVPVSSWFVRGERRNPVSYSLNKYSGFIYRVSEAGFNELEQACGDAEVFLSEHQDVLRACCRFAGIEQSRISFSVGIEDGVPSWCFANSLVRLVGDIGLDLELSQYPVSVSD